MLSNRATPYYYGKFRQAVLSGRIPVCKEIAMQMDRIDRRIAAPNFYYDPDAVEHFINFCEGELTLTDGSRLHMLDTFKLWAEDVYGWYWFEEKSIYHPADETRSGWYEHVRIKRRLCKQQYLIVGRGASKTVYLSCHHAYGLVMDKTTTNQVATAYTMNQAEETLSTLKTAVTRAPGPMFKFLTEGSIQNTTGNRLNRPKLCSTKMGIENFLTNSKLFIRPMDIDALQGLRTKYNTVDEWLSCDIRENPINALIQGASKGTDEYLLIASSSEGTVRNGPGDDIKIDLLKILKGETIEESTSIWWYKLDDIKEVADPSLWVKANPNIGHTVSYEAYADDANKAERSPADRNEILAKRFNLPLEGTTYFFTYEETQLTAKNLSCWNLPCSMGADLSQGDDFCAFTFAFPLNAGKIAVKTRCYITEHTLLKLPVSMRSRYDRFIEEGSLIVMDGTILDLTLVYEELYKYILDCGYDVRTFGYDPYNAKEFVERWAMENGPFGIEKVIQGARTESVPLGEIKKLTEARLLIFDQELFSWSMGNCMADEDSNGNRKLSKRRSDQKIDAVAALLDAFIAYKLNKEAFD